MFGKLCHHAWNVGVVFVDLVHCNNNWHFSRASVTDGFNSLRHHTVVGGNHQHNDVGHLCTARAHLGERGVTRCVDEGNGLAILYNLVCTDVLRDSACFTRDNAGRTNAIEQCSFTVVDVTHNSDHWRTEHLLLWIVVIGVIE